MIFDFLKKQKDISKRKKIISVMILSLQIHDVQKDLYLEALSILNKDGLDRLYISLSEFTKEIEIKELDDINKNNFSEIAGMRKKEAVEKQKELNSFSFLINNL
ncbi:hypothetical protein A9Q91_06175 [Candidatus Gracilibacteria bacterium 28_42_T64]|nr:hypothetical protein A9Q91_06175 [Candidatus Gracilibacteria bacterium 28_42_T64]